MLSVPVRLPQTLLDAAEEVELAIAMEAGALAADALRTGQRPCGATATELAVLASEGEAARRRFVECNLRLVAMVTYQATARSGQHEADLFQEGTVGLLTAVARFDHRRGTRFATYALFWIRAYVGAATAGRLGELNLPASRASQLRTVRGMETALTQTLGRPATVADVAAAVGRSVEWTADLLHRAAPLSLSLVEEEAARVPAPPEVAAGEVRELETAVGRLLDRLPEMEREVLRLRLGFATDTPLSYVAIGRRLGLTVARVRRTEQTALATLREVCPQSALAHL